MERAGATTLLLASSKNRRVAQVRRGLLEARRRARVDRDVWVFHAKCGAEQTVRGDDGVAAATAGGRRRRGGDGGGTTASRRQRKGGRRAAAAVGTLGSRRFTLRNARQLLLPLAALELGAGPAVVSGCVAASFVTDAAVGMTVAGALMDRCGRKPAGFAATALLAAGFAALAAALFDGTRPKTHALVFVHVAAAVIGAGNGCSSGLVMAMSTDVAPAALRGPFLGLFRVFSDAGIVVGSAAVGSLADAADVEAAASATAMVALATLGVLYRRPARESNAGAAAPPRRIFL